MYFYHNITIFTRTLIPNCGLNCHNKLNRLGFFWAGRAAFSWVGRESKEASGHHADGELVLLHFEVSLPGGLDGVNLRQAAFCEVHDDQINLVHLRDGERKVTLGFSPGREAQVVRFGGE